MSVAANRSFGLGRVPEQCSGATWCRASRPATLDQGVDQEPLCQVTRLKPFDKVMPLRPAPRGRFGKNLSHQLSEADVVALVPAVDLKSVVIAFVPRLDAETWINVFFLWIELRVIFNAGCVSARTRFPRRLATMSPDDRRSARATQQRTTEVSGAPGPECSGHIPTQPGGNLLGLAKIVDQDGTNLLFPQARSEPCRLRIIEMEVESAPVIAGLRIEGRSSSIQGRADPGYVAFALPDVLALTLPQRQGPISLGRAQSARGRALHDLSAIGVAGGQAQHQSGETALSLARLQLRLLTLPIFRAGVPRRRASAGAGRAPMLRIASDPTASRQPIADRHR